MLLGLDPEKRLVVRSIAEESALRTHARGCPVQAVVEPFLKANLFVSLLGRSLAERVLPRRVQDPLQTCEKFVQFEQSRIGPVSFIGLHFKL
jgi:hypothetical protein